MTKLRSHDPHMRVFFALWPNAAERAAMAVWQPPLRKLCGGKAMRADTLHATLVFLGDVPAHRLEALKLAAEEVGGEPFELDFDSARYWGHNHIAYAAPSVVPAPLSQLVLDLEQRLRAHRFRFDRRDYKPHVTMLRHAQWSDEPLPELPEVAWRVRDFALVQSLSDEQGARYEVLARFPLGRCGPLGLRRVV
ncbi:MAG: 2'-5' RNA ligase [Gallionellales bacterium GWA2_60_142]|nr:MAG: 2'-5' RNA ligase [Gallionellales bacterium GWA2_60_142]HCI14116.1 RNA 2',3'-cyclic phosphodiesterase [Gallionellaceae bacterium]